MFCPYANFTQFPDTMPLYLFLLEILPSSSEAVNLSMTQGKEET